MRKGLFTFAMVVLGLYLVLHLVLGSSPVQKRVVEEVRRALSDYGYDLQIESIEFSALAPKIYLNRVTIKTLPNAEIPLPHPLPIDKIKIEFQPIALLSKHLVIEEAVLFHPRILLPNADRLYKRVTQLLNEKGKAPELKGGFFTLVIKKIGVVDALFNIQSADPPISVRSRSFSAFVQNSMARQQTITVSSSNLELEREKLKLNLSNVELDVDLSEKSLRVNRLLLEGQDLNINLRASASMPTKQKPIPASLNASYEINIPLEKLNQIQELALPQFVGQFVSSGTVKIANNVYTGNGSVQYRGVTVDGYGVGDGTLAYALDDRKVAFTQVKLRYGRGELISSKPVHLYLKEEMPIEGELVLKDVKLEGILDYLKNPGIPVRMSADGPVSFRGRLAKNFEIVAELKAAFNSFYALQEDRLGVTPSNTVIAVPEGKLDAILTFTMDKMAFKANLGMLGGSLAGDGFISFENYAKLKTVGRNLSMTALGRISELQVGGKADINADLDIKGKDAKITGNFEVEDAEISEIMLGSVRGTAHYQNMLLSFEKLESFTSLDPVNANGFVDFGPKKTHYKFNVEGKRAEVNQAFTIFRKKKLAFPAPEGGEVSSRLSIEGGHDDQGMELIASGQAKNFKWYGEDWLSSNYAVTFRTDYTDLSRLLLLKKTGGMEIKGRFEKSDTRLTFISHGLLLEELNYVGRSPLNGEIVGQLSFRGDLTELDGNGELKLIKSSFRGNPVQDSSIKITSDKGKSELQAKILGESLRGRLARMDAEKKRWDLLLYFENFDFSPFSTIFMGKDLPTINEVKATGDVHLNGILDDWTSFRGSGSVATLSIGLKGTPMKNTEPVEVKVNDGEVKVSRFNLVGRDSQISMDLLYQPGRQIKASADAKIDLEFLQPFIPALEYGAGKVSAGLRLTGHPDNFNLLGNISLEDGVFRITGINDEFRAAQVQLGLSQDRINVDRFEATLNGGTVSVEGDVRVKRFTSLIPNLTFSTNRVMMRTGNYLNTRFSGDFFIRGNSAPYLLGGKCKVLEANLTQFKTEEAKAIIADPIFKLDINCEAENKLRVITDVMNAEFKGNFHLLGTNEKLGLLGSAEAIQGYILFREKRFDLNSANVKFESANSIAPRFSVSGRTIVRETDSSTTTTKVQAGQEYEINLQAYGTPANYKIILTSIPQLSEPDIISLLLLGVTGRGHEGNFLDLGTTIVGQIPLQSKLESQLGVDIRINTQQSSASQAAAASSNTPSTSAADSTVPSVKIQKDITKRTKVSYSNTLETVPVRELKIEHMLDDNLTVNGTAIDRAKGGTDAQTTQSYGLDFRYRFHFE